MTSATRKRRFALLAVATVLMLGCAGPVRPEDEARFLASLGDATITVFPAYVREGAQGTYDVASAERVAAFLNERGLAKATVSDQRVPIPGTWHMNQARMWRESADALGEFVKAHPIATDYALLPEYLGSGAPDRPLVGVHGYLVDARGTKVFGSLLNSHQEAFQAVNPRTPREGTEALIRALAASMVAQDKRG